MIGRASSLIAQDPTTRDLDAELRAAQARTIARSRAEVAAAERRHGQGSPLRGSQELPPQYGPDGHRIIRGTGRASTTTPDPSTTTPAD